MTLVDNRSNDFIKCKVIFKHEYDTTEELLKAEGVKNIFPFLNDDDIEKGIQVFNEFPGWYLVEKYGCVAFGLEVVESKSSFYLRKEEQDNDDEF